MVIDRLPELALTSEFGNIELSSVVDYVDLQITYLGKFILNERYHPDEDGRAIIRGIGEVAMNVAVVPDIFSEETNIGVIPIHFYINLTEKDAETITTHVILHYSNIDSGGTVSYLDLLSMPVTLVNEKRTGVGRKEMISFYHSSVSAYIVYKSASGDKAIRLNDFKQLTGAGICVFDVSPSVIADAADCDESDLIYYNVYKDNTSVIRFVMSEREYPHLRTFAFINSFYGQETFHALEAGHIQTKWNRNIGRISGIRRQFRPQTEKTFTVTTGWLRRNELPVLEDLLTSQRVGVWEDNTFIPVIIDTDSIKVTEKRDEIISVEFSYRYADERFKRHRFIKRRQGGIFDFTFDKTFN